MFASTTPKSPRYETLDNPQCGSRGKLGIYVFEYFCRQSFEHEHFSSGFKIWKNISNTLVSFVRYS